MPQTGVGQDPPFGLTSKPPAKLWPVLGKERKKRLFVDRPPKSLGPDAGFSPYYPGAYWCLLCTGPQAVERRAGQELAGHIHVADLRVHLGHRERAVPEHLLHEVEVAGLPQDAARGVPA